jgi:hypothetical protein
MDLRNDENAYRAALVRLIEDETFRLEKGRRVKASILGFHTGVRWLDALNTIYSDLDRIHERKCLAAREDTFESDALNDALSNLYGEPPSWGRSLIGEYIGPLHYPSRFAITWRLREKGFGLCLTNLLPPPGNTVVRTVGRRVKKMIRAIKAVR